ncbi:MAG: hypothetical protein ACYDAH_05465 [Steroidobacteraceae bacterium]
MVRRPDNVVLTRSAAEALCREFIGWQCRLRQLAARQDGGRPSSGMRPRVTRQDGEKLSPGIVMLIVESEPQVSTELFRYQYLKTQDPNERFDKMLEILQSSHFQQPARFSDLMTALFGPGSTLAALLAAEGRCILEFEQYTQGYRIPCAVARLAARHAFHQATYWHNRMFNPNVPAGIEILSFQPDWAHAARYRSD